MARMIPPFVHEGCASFGEREIFRKLRDEPGTKTWTVLHSLDLPNHRKQLSGEIDFLVVIPGKGILCIEVKACSKLSRRDGLWFYGNDATGDPRGPFKQVNHGMHSLRKQLAQARPDLARVPFFTAVIFPYVNFDLRPDEWHEWEVIDRRKFRATPLSSSILSIMDKWRSHFEASSQGTWFVRASTEPYQEQCTAIADHFRGDFESNEDARSIVERNSDELERFTKEQFEALDSMEVNSRIVFSGAAGTGKTFLALEAAKRSSASGKKVLLVCFNKLLSDWLKAKANSLKNVDVFTIHSLMLRLSGLTVTNDSPMFWEETLPDRAQAALIENFSEDMQYDALIIDEGQDLLHTPYLDFLDLLLIGGLSSGYWRMFGDFSNQAIYKTSAITLENFKAARCGGVPEAQLTVNCRNTPRIGTWAAKFGQLRPGYSRFRRPDNNIEPDTKFFKNRDEQLQQLLKELATLTDLGFSNQDIVLLSPYGADFSILSSITVAPWRDRLRPFAGGTSGGYLRHSTIQAFKGLEAQVVIVTDFDRLASEVDLSLLYIAVSRAVHKAVLFIAEPLKSKLLDLVLSREQERK